MDIKETTEVSEVKKLSIGQMLNEKLTENQLALPQNFNKDRFVQNCLYLLNNNENLSDFAKEYSTGLAQIREGMLRGAYLGLDFMSKEAYLIPYKGKLDFQMSYSGARKLAKKYSMRPILDIYAEVVRQGDEFENGAKDGQQYIIYKAKPFNEGAIIGAYAECKFADGGTISVVMSKKELDKCKNASKSNGAVWKTWEEEMMKKSAIKRLCKNIEISFESAEMTDAFNEFDSKEEENTTEIPNIVVPDDFVVDVEAKEVTS